MSQNGCPNREVLSAYSVGRLAPPTCQLVENHLEACEACQAALDALRNTDDSLAGALVQRVTLESFLQEPSYQRGLERVRELGRLLQRGPASAPEETEQLMPVTLGPYQLRKKLPGGGMGVVYQAFHPGLQRTVALKVLRDDRADSPMSVLRFKNEWAALGKLDHSHIVRVYDAGEADGCLYLAMEYVEGTNLGQFVREHGPLPVREACDYIRQAALGLQHAHERGLVHRDVKPGNLLLAAPHDCPQAGALREPAATADYQPGLVKVADFGLALLREASPLTRPDQVMGTADYMAPEQWHGSHGVDTRADVYSLGCTLYYLLAGEVPFSSPRYDTAPRKMRGHLDDPIPPLRDRRPGVPAELEAILDQMLAKEPADRYSSPAEVARALEPFSSGSQCPTAARDSRKRLRSRMWSALLVAAAAISLGLLAIAWWPFGPLARGPGALPPLKGSIDIVVARGPEKNRRHLGLDHPEALPLKPGLDYLRIEAKLNRPAYLYLVWVDTEGKASLIHPWDEAWQRRPFAEERLQELFWPSASTAAKLGNGPPGTESLLLLARDDKLPEYVVIEKLFDGLPPQKSLHRREAAWFENGLLVQGEKDRAAINFDGDRARPLLKQQVILNDPVLQTQALLRTKLKDWFPYSRAVCFSSAGDR